MIATIILIICTLLATATSAAMPIGLMSINRDDPAPHWGAIRTAVKSTCACINLAGTTPRNNCRQPQILIDAKHRPLRRLRCAANGAMHPPELRKDGAVIRVV
jgi:hypothetical protein